MASILDGWSGVFGSWGQPANYAAAGGDVSSTAAAARPQADSSAAFGKVGDWLSSAWGEVKDWAGSLTGAKNQPAAPAPAPAPTAPKKKNPWGAIGDQLLDLAKDVGADLLKQGVEKIKGKAGTRLPGTITTPQKTQQGPTKRKPGDIFATGNTPRPAPAKATPAAQAPAWSQLVQQQQGGYQAQDPNFNLYLAAAFGVLVLVLLVRK